MSTFTAEPAKTAATVAPKARPQLLQRSAIAVGSTTDPAEHEADRIADELMRMPAGSTLRRRSCGGDAGADGECAECKARRLARVAGNAPSAAPPIVNHVLSTSGRPLDGESRSFFEPRLGIDLGSVRIHDDALAAESAAAVDAHAYTVGNHIAFAGGKSPSSPNALLAHELVHVAQDRGLALHRQPRALMRCTGERTCGGACRRAGQEENIQAGQVSRREGVLRRTVPPPRESTPPPPPAPATTGDGSLDGFVCGPDVTAEVGHVVVDTRAMYAGWSADTQDDACTMLEDPDCGPVAWDIVELHNNAWILGYRPSCASAGATPHCGSSIKVGTDCHNAGSVNYVIFGAMCDLCDIWSTTMHAMIWAHKIHLRGLDADYDAAVRWADAGFAGWPTAATPPGDRNNCSPTCPTPHNGNAFRLHWYPASPTEGVGAACERSAKWYHDHKNDPDPGIFGYG